jgi:hypothetical protein
MIDVEILIPEADRLYSSLKLHFQEAIKALEKSDGREDAIDRILVKVAPQIISFKNTYIQHISSSQLIPENTTIGALNHLHGWYCQIVADISRHFHPTP